MLLFMIDSNFYFIMVINELFKSWIGIIYDYKFEKQKCYTGYSNIQSYERYQT